MLARRTRSAFTLVELMFVVAIIFALAALGISTSREMIPRFRTRQAAYEMARYVEYARQVAMTERLETRIRMVEFDDNADSTGYANKGMYRIQIGNRSSGSTNWDTLPYESGSSDSNVDQGTYDLSQSGGNYKKDVSIDDWGQLTGPGSGNADAIVFGPRGWVLNPPEDFDNLGSGNGYIEIPFVNKASIKEDVDAETFTVQIYRTGMVRVESNRGAEYDYERGGTGASSTYDGSSGSSSTTE